MKLLTVSEVSRILKAKPKTVYQWAELGQMPCVKLNGCLRFDLDDILSWIKRCKKEPVSGYNPVAKLEALKGGKNKYEPLQET